MMKTFFKWLAGIFGEHVVLQLVASPAVAYGLGWIIAVQRGVEAMFDAVPPLFWPILATLVLLLTLYPGFIAPVIRWRQRKKNSYFKEVEAVYRDVSRIHKPNILNPQDPGNPDAMKELAQRAVDVLRPKIIQKRKGIDIPLPIDVDDDRSLRQWYDFLRNERVRASG